MSCCENCVGCKNSEARVSIIIPNLLEDKTVEDVKNEIMCQHESASFGYNIAITEDGDIIVGGIVPDAVLISDRELSNDLVIRFYTDIMDYHQAIGEELLDEEFEVRDREVREKWLNGNFNYWILREEGEV